MSATGDVPGLPPRWGSVASWMERHGRRRQRPPEPLESAAGPDTLPGSSAAARRALAGDAHRPLPGANAWPDDAVLLTYSELRRLVALHLDLARQSMPGDRPWAWLDARSAAVRDGEVPLLISEVMEP